MLLIYTFVFSVVFKVRWHSVSEFGFLPERYQPILYANPLTFIIEQSRDVLKWGQSPDWQGLAIAVIISFPAVWFGFARLQKTRGGFADVL